MSTLVESVTQARAQASQVQNALSANLTAMLDQLLAAIRDIDPSVTVMPAPVDLSAVVDSIGQLQAYLGSLPVPQVNVPSNLSVAPTEGAIFDVRNVEPIRLDDATVKALKSAAGATQQAARVMSSGGSYGPVVDKLGDLQDVLDNILTELGGSASGKANLLDYDGRTDGNPVYVGSAPQGTATSAASWTVQRLEYDASSRLTIKQEITDAVWDDRASLSWAAY